MCTVHCEVDVDLATALIQYSLRSYVTLFSRSTRMKLQLCVIFSFLYTAIFVSDVLLFRC